MTWVLRSRQQKLRRIPSMASAYKSLNGTRYDSQGAVAVASSIDGRISSWKNRLYIYKPVSEERAESSNGTVEIYELSFE